MKPAGDYQRRLDRQPLVPILPHLPAPAAVVDAAAPAADDDASRVLFRPHNFRDRLCFHPDSRLLHRSRGCAVHNDDVVVVVVAVAADDAAAAVA